MLDEQNKFRAENRPKNCESWGITTQYLILPFNINGYILINLNKLSGSEAGQTCRDRSPQQPVANIYFL